jgi:phenylacetate-CoA ligase
VVSGQIAQEAMTLHCEVADPASAGVSGADIVESIRKLTKLRGEVQFVPVGSLPNDGKVIADVRDYQ